MGLGQAVGEKLRLHIGHTTEHKCQLPGAPHDRLYTWRPLTVPFTEMRQEGQDLDDTVWNVSMAAGVCLGLVAQTVRDEILPLVIQPFVQVRHDCVKLYLLAHGPQPDSGLEILSATAKSVAVVLTDEHPAVDCIGIAKPPPCVCYAAQHRQEGSTRGLAVPGGGHLRVWLHPGGSVARPAGAAGAARPHIPAAGWLPYECR
jgi:hypothetical protein